MNIKNEIYILAEMAASHEGNIEIAEEIIKGAAKAKAGGILLQLIDLESYIVPNDPDYQNIKSFNMSFSAWEKLIEKANSSGLDVWANIYDFRSAQFCRDKKIKGFKLHSSNLENSGLIKEIVNQNKDILLSVGGMREPEIKNCIEDGPLSGFLNISKYSNVPNLTLMYGMQNFPTEPEGINLNFISNLSRELNLKWGYQDHSDPSDAASTYLPILAVSCGASIIEKHIIDEREEGRRDYQSALNPDEFEQFVRDIRTADTIISKQIDEVSQQEKKYKEYKTLMKVVAVKNIKAGERFSRENIAVMRCKSGKIPGRDLEKLIGKESKNNYKKFSPIYF